MRYLLCRAGSLLVLSTLGLALVLATAARADFVSGRIYLSANNDAGAGRVYEFDPSNGNFHVFAEVSDAAGGVTTGLTFTPDGTHLRASVYLSSSIAQIDGAGNVSQALGPADGIVAPLGGNNIAYNAAGDFFEANGTGNILRFPAAGGPAQIYGDPSDGVRARGPIALAPNGDLYYAVEGSNFFRDIVRFTGPGQSEVFDTLPQGLLESLAVDSAGNVFALSDYGLFRYDAGNPTTRRLLASGLQIYPGSSIAVSADASTIYVSRPSRVLRNGKVLCVDFLSSYPDNVHPNRPDAVLFDPNDATIKLVWEEGITVPGVDLPNNHRLNCSGHCQLSDGIVLFRGGVATNLPQGQEAVGNIKTTLYDPMVGSAGAFVNGPDEVWCVDTTHCPWPTRRYYPTLTTLGNGDVLSTDGLEPQAGATWPANGDAGTPVVLQPNVGVPTTWTWEPLTTANYCGYPQTGYCRPSAPYSFDLGFYPFMFLLSDGKVFMASSAYTDPLQLYSRKLDVGAAAWDAGYQVATPIRGVAAVMYQKDKILLAGGINPSQPHTGDCSDGQVISSAYTLNAVTDTMWAFAGNMSSPRVNFYLIPLPDGRVLALGGARDVDGSCICKPGNAVLETEVWDPYAPTPSWTVLAPTSGTATPRLHHWVALLLPDGSVFTAGSQVPVNTGCGVPQQVTESTYQIYQPPYFGSTRPTWTTWPTVIYYGRNFVIQSQDADSVNKVRLIRLGAVTHSFDQNGRSLEFDPVHVNSTKIRVTAPQNGDFAPPGYYMLFIATGTNGSVPSKGKIVRVIPPPVTN